MKLLLVAVAFGFAMIGPPVVACSPPPSDQAAARARDLRTMTSVYEARIETVAVAGPYGEKIDFTVRPTAAIWGPVSPRPFRLSFEAGTCSNWFFVTDDHSDRPPLEGLEVIVMANPEGLADDRWLYILRADADYAQGFMRQWRAIRAGQSLPRTP